MITTQRFVRKPLHVDAVRITRDNFDAIAEWCQGEIKEDPKAQGSRKRYIHVRVHNPKNDRQRMAYVGDWLLYTDRGYKVYTNKAFNLAFDLAEGFADLVQKARETGEIPPLAPEADAPEPGLITGAAPIETVPSEGRVIENAELHSVGLMAEDPSPETGVGPILDVSPELGDPMEEPYEETAIPQPNEVAVEETPAAPTFTGGAGTADGWGSGDVREDVIAADEEFASEKERVPPPPVAPESPEMAQARATIEAEGGSLEEATPEAIVDVVAEQEAARVAAEAAGKRVLSVKEQQEMDQDEIRALLSSGDVILAQDLAA